MTEEGITGTAHPIHIHGHHFQVVKIGWPDYDPDTLKFSQNNADIKCDNSSASCNVASWANESWGGGYVPGLTETPVVKDTVIIPAGGYVIVRFLADNPGKSSNKHNSEISPGRLHF